MKYLGHLIGILTIQIIFYFLIYYVEIIGLESGVVVPPTGVTIGQWLDDFKYWAVLGITMAGVASLLWYVLAQWGFKVNKWTQTNKGRPTWLLFFLLPIAFAIWGIIKLKTPGQGAWLAYLCFSVNGLLCYYFPTALFSPSAFKYAPLGARLIWRRLW